MNSYNRQWQGYKCDSFYTLFVCYNGRQNAPQTYVLVFQWSTWYQAQSYCREYYTDLAIVRNQTEYQAILDETQNVYYSSFWIGLYGNETWSDGDTSSNYYTNVNRMNQSCVTAQYNHTYNWFNTENCNNTLSFVCYGPMKNKSLAANVSCNESSMTVVVEKSSIVGLRVDHLRLSDPSCSMNSNSTHIFRTLDLNSCGTQLEEEGDNLIFRNVITSFDDSSNVITREQQVEAELSCVFPKKGTVSLEFLVHKIPYIFSEKGFGKFTYQFEFFHSSLFNSMVDPASYPVELELKEMVYMEITSTTSILNTEMFVESCQATPSDNPDDPIHYSIIQNGCKKDDTVQIYPSPQSQFRFGMEAFTFIGLHDQVYISCSVILCESGNPNTRCAQGCIDSASRHRREAILQTTSHYISQGPLRVRRNADGQGSHVTLNLNMVVFIAGCLLVCGVVIYRSRKSKVKYQLVPTDQ
uniref:ZP domain-containing protein n=1 Tax=Esox lucius TaxID=8010 RepID=A0A6Q2YLN1_ESOLU